MATKEKNDSSSEFDVFSSNADMMIERLMYIVVELKTTVNQHSFRGFFSSNNGSYKKLELDFKRTIAIAQRRFIDNPVFELQITDLHEQYSVYEYSKKLAKRRRNITFLILLLLIGAGVYYVANNFSPETLVISVIILATIISVVSNART